MRVNASSFSLEVEVPEWVSTFETQPSAFGPRGHWMMLHSNLSWTACRNPKTQDRWLWAMASLPAANIAASALESPVLTTSADGWTLSLTIRLWVQVSQSMNGGWSTRLVRPSLST